MGLLSKLFNGKNGLSQPGDNASAYVTKSNRQVIKIIKNNGKSKYSATRYPNGTTVETRTNKK